jgi:hypothetical protein
MGSTEVTKVGDRKIGERGMWCAAGGALTRRNAAGTAGPRFFDLFQTTWERYGKGEGG